MHRMSEHEVVAVLTFCRRALATARECCRDMARATRAIEESPELLRLYATRSYSPAFWANHAATWVEGLPMRRAATPLDALRRIARYENQLTETDRAVYATDACYLEMWRAELDYYLRQSIEPPKEALVLVN
jgi:hypothetical protein